MATPAVIAQSSLLHGHAPSSSAIDGRAQAQAPARPAAGDRSGAAGRLALAIDRPGARRTIAGRRRQRQPAARVLLRRHRRRTVEDDRRRLDLAARSPTSSSRHPRSARSPSRSRTRTSSTSAWARPNCAATSSRATASTRSTDGGKTWTHVGLEKTLAIARIRVHPTNPDIVYVAALGDPYGPNPERGVFKIDRRRKDLDEVAVPRRQDRRGRSRRWMPQHPDVLYAGLWEVFRTPHSLSSGGPGSGLFKTTDGGATLDRAHRATRAAEAALGQDRRRRFPAPMPTASTRSSRPPTAACSCPTTPARRWKLVNDDRRLRQRAFYYTRIYADPQAKDTVYVLNTGIYRSTDAGKTIRAIRVPHGDNHDLWIAPNDPQRMINSNDGGANVSINGGETWTDQDFPTAQFYNVITTAHVPYHVCGAQQDNSTACVLEHRRRRRSTTSAAARAATSRPIRKTRTCSTPAATAAC